MKIEGIVAATANAAPQVLANEGRPKVNQDQTEQAVLQQQISQHAPKDQKEVGSKLLASAVDQIDKMLSQLDDSLRISIHQETHSVMVRIVNNQTGEVLREIPPEKFLDMVASFQKQLAGLFVDERK